MSYDPIPCIERGAALLTEHLGEAWVHGINVHTLEILIASRCVLGQTFGNYGYGITKLFGSGLTSSQCEQVAIAHGFLAPGEGRDYEMLSACLQNAWIAYINEQRIKRERLVHV